MIAPFHPDPDPTRSEASSSARAIQTGLGHVLLVAEAFLENLDDEELGKKAEERLKEDLHSIFLLYCRLKRSPEDVDDGNANCNSLNMFESMFNAFKCLIQTI